MTDEDKKAFQQMADHDQSTAGESLTLAAFFWYITLIEPKVNTIFS